MSIEEQDDAVKDYQAMFSLFHAEMSRMLDEKDKRIEKLEKAVVYIKTEIERHAPPPLRYNWFFEMDMQLMTDTGSSAEYFEKKLAEAHNIMEGMSLQVVEINQALMDCHNENEKLKKALNRILQEIALSTDKAFSLHCHDKVKEILK